MTPEQLSAHLTEILTALSNEGQLNVDLPETVKVERPKNRDHGDWATNIALQLGKRAGLAPRELAQMIADKLSATPGVASVDIAGPGFINVTLDTAAAAEIARTIVEAGANYGNNDALAGHNINMEFVSANPTGPLHIGHTRWAALGDSIVRMLRASGADVTAEYYINDAGSQMDVFATSIYRRMHGLEVQEGGYPGQYIGDMAEQILAEDPSVKDLSEAEALPVLRERGYALQMKDIKDTLADFGVHFDVYFSESDLHNQGKIEEAVARLKEQGHVYEEDGATWLRTSEFGDDKDRVLIRANGAPTYFAADAAYYLNKRDRGFAEKIYLLGADHHGYIGRLRAIAAAAGDDAAANIEILIGQLMSVNGARLSKRAGNIIELKDLIEWLGTDALRYSLERVPADSPIDLDPEVLRTATNENPVFYIQYAHARSRQAARAAADRGVDRSVFDASLLNHPAENDLLAALTAYPSAVVAAAQRREPHRVARHIESVAAAYHTWYAACRITPVGDEAVEDVHRTRLWLNDATTTVIANGLELLGVSAPEKM
ncbi:arginine--tRNA ligase [Pseudoglutamicibacter cumminsii]|uniref:arginine--tRNA ligase n=1 Tax=Pseudoglutamicibacter cumminsii TaxID=156979 RepID=UPI001956B71C|nr:arginyl-tRNA synthetase [Pseudoglutamicibacter cumminsii]